MIGECRWVFQCFPCRHWVSSPPLRPAAASAPDTSSLLHGQFATLSPASNYALTLTHTHIHIQRLSSRPGKEARLLLPLSELVGCSCPRSPAPPLLVLYWYPQGKRRKGVSRRRQVKAYLAESRPEAERWSAAIQCLLREVPVTANTGDLLPRPRRLLLLVNPFSGRGQAMQWCQTHILPMIREANISYNLIQTERRNHARELIREISLPEWDGIVIVSGDGLMHEVINGLMERPDWEQAIKTPLGILPCGSGNALAGSINHYPLLLNCCFLLCQGGIRPMDLVSVTISPLPSKNSHAAAPRRLFSFLSVAWGFVSDVDIESERYRGLGSARFTLGTLVRIASLRSYKGRLSYMPPSVVATSSNGTPPPRRLLSRSITEVLDQNQNTSRPRPHSLLQHSSSNSLPPKMTPPSFSPTPPSSPSCSSPRSSSYLTPRPNTPNSTLNSPSFQMPSSSFNFDLNEPAGLLRNRPFVSLPFDVPRDDLLPPLDQPLPTRDWVTIEGDFVLVLALYQSHLGADLHAAPHARFDDGLIHLTFVRAGISRATLLRLFFAMEKGNHHSLSSPYVSHITCKAFRLQPLSPRGTLTVDGELVPYGPLQAQIHPSMARLVVGDTGVKITRL
uniref:sphingosine kinase n=1 Tax=Xiphophorus couchianus TaxID=32473 RepID=A0A3B5MRE1_9TELE